MLCLKFHNWVIFYQQKELKLVIENSKHQTISCAQKSKRSSFFSQFTNYYRKFVQNFAQKAHGLHLLLRKNVEFTLNDLTQQSFEILKDALCTAPVLIIQIYFALSLFLVMLLLRVLDIFCRKRTVLRMNILFVLAAEH